jgi:hypothetical protein
VDHESYLTSFRERLAADGCTVKDEDLGPVRAVVGYRSDLLPQAMFSKIHLFTVAAATPEANAFAVQDFTQRVGSYAKNAKGQMRGLQSGVTTFAILVADHVLPEAVQLATRPPKLEFAVRTQSAIVDLSAGTVHTFRGRQLWGFALNGHLRRKLNLYAPGPT